MFMKRLLCFLFLFTFCFSLFGCAKVYSGNDGLIQKAREEIPHADADTVDIMIAGSTDTSDSSLVWFITGNEYQKHSYYPMEFKHTKKDPSHFEFVHMYKPYDAGKDIAVCSWNGFAVLVNNKACTEIRVTYPSGATDTITVNGIPFLWHTDPQPSEFTFWDANGNEIF